MQVRWYGTAAPTYWSHSPVVRSRPTMVHAARSQSDGVSDQVAVRTNDVAAPGEVARSPVIVTVLPEVSKLTTNWL